MLLGIVYWLIVPASWWSIPNENFLLSGRTTKVKVSFTPIGEIPVITILNDSPSPGSMISEVFGTPLSFMVPVRTTIPSEFRMIS